MSTQRRPWWRLGLGRGAPHTQAASAASRAGASGGGRAARLVGAALALGVALTADVARADNEASFCTFQSASALVTVNGSAAIPAGAPTVLRLVSNSPNQIGTAYLPNPITVTAATSFHTHFRFALTPSGGEGIVFTIQGVGPNATSATYGATLGYTGITNSIAVEFDIHQDAGEDTNSNHVAVRANGSTTTLATTATGVPAMDNATTDAWIDYDGAADEIKVYVSSTTTKPASPVIDYTGLDLTTVGSSGYPGFTSSTTGSTKANADVTYWVFTTGSSLFECTACSSQPTCNSVTYAPVCDTNRQQCVPCSNDNGAGSLACPSASAPACQKSGTLQGECTACSSTNASLCTSTTPVCDVSTGACGSCNGDNGLPVSRACPTTSLPACQGSGACTQCGVGNTGNCAGTTPTCNPAGACVGCNGDNGNGAASQPCTTTTQPACQANGSCTECSATHTDLCTGNKPTCNTTSGVCAGCNGDNGQAVSRACPTTTSPACQVTGACTECSASNLSLCNGQTPTCSGIACAPCDSDFGDGMTQSCPSGTSPYCFLSGGQAGSCGVCTSSADCAGHASGSVCNTVTGACGSSCAVDENCTSTKWCLASVCTPKTPNGQPVPASAGTCSPAVGARVCTSGVCETIDDICGLVNGSTCEGAGTDAGVDGGDDAGAIDAGGDAGANPLNAVCRSGICAADGKCGARDGEACATNAQCRSTKCEIGVCVECTTDTDCGGASSGRICDDTSRSCVDGCRGSAFGNGCPSGQTCSSDTSAQGACSTPSDGGVADGSVGTDGGMGADATVDGEAPDGAVNVADDGEGLRGGAFSCASSPMDAGTGALGAFASLGVVTLLSLRRRRRR